jgi:hypothetical protein
MGSGSAAALATSLIGRVAITISSGCNTSYDFGDSWEHRLTVSNVRAGDPDCAYPRYVRGERNDPPEDCGGIPGFYDKLEAIADPSHPDHRVIKRWLRGDDAEAIDEASINARSGASPIERAAEDLAPGKGNRLKKAPRGFGCA